MADELRRSEIARVLRKHLAWFCKLSALEPDQQAAVNEIRASTQAARYPSVAAALDPVVLKVALTSSSYGQVTAKNLFYGSTKKVLSDTGLVPSQKKWPAKWIDHTLSELADALA